MKQGARNAAKLSGAIKYYTGKPCVNGHISERYTDHGSCAECLTESVSARSSQIAESVRLRKENPSGYARWLEVKTKHRRAKRSMPQPTRPQPSACECCGGKQIERSTILDLDHDHVTGQFRGWLCNTCNRGLGYFGDNLEGVMRAVEYLRKNSM